MHRKRNLVMLVPAQHVSIISCNGASSSFQSSRVAPRPAAACVCARLNFGRAARMMASSVCGVAIAPAPLLCVPRSLLFR